MIRKKAYFWTTALVLFFIGLLNSCSLHPDFVVGFYNVENLFDTKDNPDKIDEQFLPEGDYKWDTEKYEAKIEHIAEVISKMNNGSAPDILGLCEVENRKVLKDLVKHKLIKDMKYKIIHYESPDARGIDVALLYSAIKFKEKDSEAIKVDLSEFGETTRDILWVQLTPERPGADLHFFVNHWPSRREGKDASEPKRIKAAKTLASKIRAIQTESAKAPIVVLGDFNDEPYDVSIREYLNSEKDAEELDSTSMFNPMAMLKDSGQGSYNFRGNWNMLDQILLSPSLVDGEQLDYVKSTAKIFGPQWLRQHGGKYDQYPFRNFGGRKYLNGYSDHFAVTVMLSFAN